MYLPIPDKSPDPNDKEVAQFFNDNRDESDKPHMERSKSLRARMSPSRSKLFRSMRRRSGGSNNEDNDVIAEVETGEKKQEPVQKETLLPGRSNSLGHRRNLTTSFLYDSPRKTQDSKSPVTLTKVKAKPSGVKNSNLGAYENVILQTEN